MKISVLGLLSLIVTTTAFAQQDTTKAKKGIEVIKIGNMTVIKTPSDSLKTADSSKQTMDTIKIGPDLAVIGKGISEGLEKLGKAIGEVDLSKLGDLKKEIIKKKKPKKVSTNWFVYDIGFAGYNDITNYNTPDAQNFLRNQTNGIPAGENDYALKTTRISNFNLWFFMQRVSLIASVLNIKYGFGIESNNYFYKTGITYVDGADVYTNRNPQTFSKNKLVANYLTVPLMLNLNTNPARGKRGFQVSAGISAGYLSSARQKQKSSAGIDKNKSNFNLQPFKLAYVGELGLGPVKLYGSIATTTLHKNALEQMPYTVGVRFSN
jgi:hypothetical protein